MNFWKQIKSSEFRILVEKIFQSVSRQITSSLYLIGSSENGASKGKGIKLPPHKTLHVAVASYALLLNNLPCPKQQPQNNCQHLL